MPQFEYKVKDKTGKTVTGTKSSKTKEELVMDLERQDLTIIDIKEITTKKPKKEKIFKNLKIGKKRISSFELITMCKQLAAMLRGGVPIINAMESIANEVRDHEFREVLLDLSNNIRKGKSLTESFKKHPDVFSVLFVAIIEAGETTGSLDKMLRRLVGYLESRDRLIRKMRSVTTYPIFIASFFTLAVGVITVFLVPRFQSIYKSFGAKLPPLTLLVFNISNFFVKNMFILTCLFIIIIFALFVFIRNTKKGRSLFDNFILKLPIFGEIIKKAAISKFCRTLATLLDQGISITDALHLVGRTSGNIAIEEASDKVRKLVLEGETIPKAFSKTGIFPILMLQMASVGVDAGSLPELMDQTADFYEEQVDTFVSTLMTIIEPVLIVSLGAVISIVVIALYLPIFNLGSAMSTGGY